VPGFLRFVGLFNAAVWVGGSVFFSFLAASVFFTPEVKAFAPPPANGLVAQAVLGRYFALHYICGTIASLHLFIEWLYNGGGFPKRAISIVCVLLGLALVGGKFISPKLTVWHQQKHQVELKSDGGLTMNELEADVVQNAERKFAVWHGVSQLINLAMVILLIWRFWRMTHPNEQDGLNTFGQRKRNLFAK
jgi:p-aminobenzoyl-glutamate transporter AbgT